MNTLLVCPKRRGNTFRVCRYVANNSDAELMVINHGEVDDLRRYTSIVLCSGVYGHGVHRTLRRWLAQIDRASLREDARFHMFLTWFGRGQSDRSAVRDVKSILEKMGLSLEDDYVTCYGRGMWIIRYGHPNIEDCIRVLDWVRSRK